MIFRNAPPTENGLYWVCYPDGGEPFTICYRGTGSNYSSTAFLWGDRVDVPEVIRETDTEEQLHARIDQLERRILALENAK
jgi:hypothetical protein